MTLQALIRHAERFGVEEVYETAEDERLTAADLARLAKQLRRIDGDRVDDDRASRARHRIEPIWRLTADQRDRLFVGLAEAGSTDKALRQALDVTQPTLRRMHADLGMRSSVRTEASSPHEQRARSENLDDPGPTVRRPAEDGRTALSASALPV